MTALSLSVLSIGDVREPRRWARRRIWRLAIAIAISLTWIAEVIPAAAATNTASLGKVTATLTYQKAYPVAGNIGTPEARNSILTIRVGGRLVYRAGVYSPVCARLCWPEPTYGLGTGDPLRVVRLAAGSPDVVLGLYSGGAHCCFIDQVFSPGSGTFYAKTEVELGDPGARLVTLPGNPYVALLTADDTFAYAFTDFAASGLPIKILRVVSHRVTDVTRQYPSLIRADASRWLSAFYAQASSHYDDSVGVIAAWAADEYLVGRVGAANQFLRQQAAAGHLNSLLIPSQKATVFVALLEKFLSQHGY
jgi:hypothetical protein